MACWYKYGNNDNSDDDDADVDDNSRVDCVVVYRGQEHHRATVRTAQSASCSRCLNMYPLLLLLLLLLLLRPVAKTRRWCDFYVCESLVFVQIVTFWLWVWRILEMAITRLEHERQALYRPSNGVQTGIRRFLLFESRGLLSSIRSGVRLLLLQLGWSPLPLADEISIVYGQALPASWRCCQITIQIKPV